MKKEQKFYYIPTKVLYCHPSEGKMTLQVPNFFDVDSLIADPKVGPVVECPEEWFWTLNSQKLPSETGFRFWSKQGWFKNRKQIKEAFESASHILRGGKSWEAYDEFAKDFFKDIEQNTEDEIQKLKEKIKQLNALQFKLW